MLRILSLICLSAMVAAQEVPTSSAQAVPEAKPDELRLPGLWNQWRGPERTGVCPGSWPKRLNEKNCVRQWRVKLPVPERTGE